MQKLHIKKRSVNFKNICVPSKNKGAASGESVFQFPYSASCISILGSLSLSLCHCLSVSISLSLSF